MVRLADVHKKAAPKAARQHAPEDPAMCINAQRKKDIVRVAVTAALRAPNVQRPPALSRWGVKRHPTCSKACCRGGGWFRSRAAPGKAVAMRSATAELAAIIISATTSIMGTWGRVRVRRAHTKGQCAVR